VKALLALALIALGWGYNWVVMKEALRYAGPFEFLAWRFALAGALLLGLLVAMKRPLAPPFPREVFLIGLLQTACNFGFVAWALLTGAAGKSSVLTYTMPFWVVVFAWLALRERPTTLQWAAMVPALAGIALLVGGGGDALAAWLALTAGITWAVGVVIAKRLQTRERVDAVAVSAWQTIFGGAILVALALVFPSRETEWTAYFVFALLYNAVLVSAVCWVLWFWVLARLQAGLASLAVLAVPVVGMLAGVIELGERPTGMEWTGMALVIAALALVALAAGRPR